MSGSHWDRGSSLTQFNDTDQLFILDNNTNNIQAEQLPINQLNNPFQFVISNADFTSNHSTDNFDTINSVRHEPTNSNVATDTTLHQLNPEVPDADNGKAITQLFSVPSAAHQLIPTEPSTNDRQNIVQQTPLSPPLVTNSSASVSNNSTHEFFFWRILL